MYCILGRIFWGDEPHIFHNTVAVDQIEREKVKTF